MRKLTVAACIVLLFLCAGCSKKTETVENPGDFLYQGKLIHFEETKTEIEDLIKDAEGCSIFYSDQRVEGTEVFVTALISSDKFVTYKGIKVGDDRKKVDDTFHNIITDHQTLLVVFDEDGEKAVSSNVGEWNESDYVIHYTLDEQDKIKQIAIGDVAGKYFMK